MSDNNIVSMNINESLIKPIVEAQMKQAILDNMGDVKSYMEQLISIALNEKCDIEGRTDWYYGETHCLTEWAEILGIKRSVLSSRINTYGWSIEQAFNVKVKDGE